MSWRAACRHSLRAARSTRPFSSSLSLLFPRQKTPRTGTFREEWSGPSEKALAEELEERPEAYISRPLIPGKTFFNEDAAREVFEEFNYDDTTSVGHRHLEQQRRVLHYFRLIEHEMPQLVAFRKPFVPPTSATPVIVRSITYGGEEHPATAKRVIVAKVAGLPLRTKAAVHKFCVLAGVRWTPDPPKDSGFRYREEGGQHGYIKISCEDFPEPAQNLKWASDTLDRLIEEANNLKDDMSDIPIDTRHVQAKAIKDRIGYKLPDFAGGRTRRVSPPSIRDFPPSWLPKHPPRTQ